MTQAAKKIGFFLPTLQAGGAERMFVNMAVDFYNAGYEVDFLLKQKKGEFLSEIPPGVRIIDLDAPRMIASLPGLTRYMRNERPLALISGLELPNLIAILSGKLAGSKSRIIVTVRSMVSKHRRYFLPARRLERIMMRKFYPLADHIVAVSKSAAFDFSNYLAISVEKIKVIYNPVLTPQFNQKVGEKLDHPWFAPDQPPVILGVGRLSQVKDFQTLIRSFYWVQTNQPARLLILGEGPQRGELETLIANYGLQNSIQLPGFVPNPYPYFKRSTVFVLSSLYDASPNVLVEAMACSCPVVSTDCPGGASELIGHGKYGHLAPVGNEKALAEAIIQVFQGDRRPAPPEWLANFSSQTAFEQYRALVEGSA